MNINVELFAKFEFLLGTNVPSIDKINIIIKLYIYKTRKDVGYFKSKDFLHEVGIRMLADKRSLTEQDYIRKWSLVNDKIMDDLQCI